MLEREKEREADRERKRERETETDRDAHRGEEGAHHVPPQKTLKKWIKYKNVIKHVNREPPPRFSHNRKYPLKRI
jgi:hypothetical protein